MELTGWDAAAVLTKALCYATTFGAAGAHLFMGYSHALLSDAQRRSIKRHILLLSALAILTSVLRVPLLDASMSGAFAGMLDVSSAGMILSAGEGWSLGLRVVGLVLGMAAFTSSRALHALAFAGALIAAASFAALGHVHALKPDAVPLTLVVLHLTCAAFWLGALWPLLRAARDEDTAQTAVLARRFGQAALYVVACLIVAGSLLAYQLLGGITAFWTSSYGRLLGLKLLLAAALLSAAAFNKLSLTARLNRGERQALGSLRRSIRFELGIGGLILLTTATLTSLTGPAD